MDEIIRELTALKDTNKVSSEQILMCWRYRGVKGCWTILEIQKQFDSEETSISLIMIAIERPNISRQSAR